MYYFDSASLDLTDCTKQEWTIGRSSEQVLLNCLVSFVRLSRLTWPSCEIKATCSKDGWKPIVIWPQQFSSPISSSSLQGSINVRLSPKRFWKILKGGFRTKTCFSFIKSLFLRLMLQRECRTFGWKRRLKLGQQLSRPRLMWIHRLLLSWQTRQSEIWGTNAERKRFVLHFDEFIYLFAFIP